ncbi:leucine efflux protein LeuE [Leeia sp. TBRC 13508]|uniref:Leucine efflux protein LeuE n=1 Tax=Leeia speluncae TaxID=2884804 RepID=A0ABS8D241_9NEIS|nr:leucine efflux protein LeuE [Leeia speluncae]MCB6182259.1 leucine efflux protein LeuE [Leeia speluncae]
MFYGVTDITTYLLGVVFIILLPGPNSLYVLSVAARKGVRQGFSGAFGIFLGDTILITLTSLGAASVLKTFPALFMLLKYAGAAYLAWIGVTMLKSAIGVFLKRNKVNSSSFDTSSAQEERGLNAPFKRALVISLLNPKAILFLLSFFVQFVDKTYPYPVVTFLILGGAIQIGSVIYLSTVILAGAKLANYFKARYKLCASLNAGVGALFLGFGGKLASATIH